jgi:hypothetical protein
VEDRIADEEEYRLLCLARWLAKHPNKRKKAARMEELHGKAFVNRLRELIKKHGQA